MGNNDEHDPSGLTIAMTSIVGLLLLAGTAAGGCFGCPAYARYQRIQDAENNVQVSQIEIQNQTQMVQVEEKKAEVRVADAKGIADSQKIIDSSLTPNYLQYLAIDAQKSMANGTNHTEIYIPSGPNGIPLVKTVDPSPTPPTK